MPPLPVLLDLEGIAVGRDFTDGNENKKNDGPQAETSVGHYYVLVAVMRALFMENRYAGRLALLYAICRHILGETFSLETLLVWCY